MTYSSCVSPGPDLGDRDLQVGGGRRRPEPQVEAGRTDHRRRPREGRCLEGGPVRRRDGRPVVGRLGGPRVARRRQVVRRADGGIGPEGDRRGAGRGPRAEGAPGTQVEVHDLPRRGPRRESCLVGGLQRPGPEAAPSVVEEHSDARVLRGVGGPGRGDRGRRREAQRRRRDGLRPGQRAVEDRRQRGEGRLGARHAPRHVDLQELEPARDRVRTEGVDVGPVQHRDVDVLVPLQRGDEGGPLRSHLLVLQCADQEHGHRDVRRPHLGRARVEERRRPGQVRTHERVEALGLRVQALVGQAGRVPRRDLRPRPALAALRRRLGVRDALGDPARGEPVVVDTPGVPGRVQVVGGAQRCDGGQVRRPGSRHDELGESGVRDADHADLVVQHPRLRPHGLDDVVAVVVRREAEQVEGSSRAAGAPHLETHGGEAEERCEGRADDRRGVGEERVVRRLLPFQRVDQAVGSGHVVAGVLDHRRERAVGLGLARREAHGRSQEDPVAHAQVVEPCVKVLGRIERRVGARGGGQHRELAGAGGARPGALLETEARPRGEVAHDEAAEPVHHTGPDGGPGRVDDGEVHARRGADDVRLADRAVTSERQCGGCSRRSIARRGPRGHEHHGGTHADRNSLDDGDQTRSCHSTTAPPEGPETTDRSAPAGRAYVPARLGGPPSATP